MFKILNDRVLRRVDHVLGPLSHVVGKHLVVDRPAEEALNELVDHTVGVLVRIGARVRALDEQAAVGAVVRDSANFHLKVANLERTAHAFDLRRLLLDQEARLADTSIDGGESDVTGQTFGLSAGRARVGRRLVDTKTRGRIVRVQELVDDILVDQCMIHAALHVILVQAFGLESGQPFLQNLFVLLNGLIAWHRHFEHIGDRHPVSSTKERSVFTQVVIFKIN